jgi:hypothetical protein
MIKQLFFILFVAIIILSSCDVFFQILIKNETAYPIAVCIGWDTIPNTENNMAEYCLSSLIDTGGIQLQTIRGTSASGHDSYKLTFFVYNKDTLIKYKNTIYIDTNRLYVRRFTYSYNQLKKMNWNVVIK